jgi:hypothetical protein
MSGYREKSFLPDGQSDSKVDFAIITIIPTSGVLENVDYTFEFSFDNQTFNGKFVRHPFF